MNKPLSVGHYVICMPLIVLVHSSSFPYIAHSRVEDLLAELSPESSSLGRAVTMDECEEQEIS